MQCLSNNRVCANELHWETELTPIQSFIHQELSERVEMILTLLTSGREADVNLTTGNGDENTPLHLAADVRILFIS